MRIGWRTDNPPEEKGDYLVTYKSGDMDIARWTNDSFFWQGKTTIWHWVCAQYCEVVAWMPLPEPYKEGEDT